MSTGTAPGGRDLAGALDAGLARLDLPLPPTARSRLLAYVQLLAKWNRIYNLTAIREPERMVTHHLLDSLAVLPALDVRVQGRERVRLLDVGSGAGLPGVPLAIARPEWHVVMLEPVHKKAAFLTQAKAELDLGNAEVAAVRVEDYVPPEPFALVISRAFADLAAFAHAAAPQLAPGGFLCAMKGVHPDEELAELPAGHAVIAIAALDVPGLDARRHLVILQPKDAAP